MPQYARLILLGLAALGGFYYLSTTTLRWNVSLTSEHTNGNFEDNLSQVATTNNKKQGTIFLLVGLLV